MAKKKTPISVKSENESSGSVDSGREGDPNKEGRNDPAVMPSSRRSGSRSVAAPSGTPAGDASTVKAHAVAKENRSRLKRRKGVLGVWVGHAKDEKGRPTGEVVINVDVAKLLDPSELRWNQVLPESIDEVRVKVGEAKGTVLLGKPEAAPNSPRIRRSSKPKGPK